MVKEKILVIDDDPKILQLIERLLRREGYQVFCAKSGQDVMGQIEEGELPDLIISDVYMPDMTGPEIVNWLRVEKSCNAPFFFLTGMISKEEEDYQLQIKMGEESFSTLAKPFVEEDLLALVRAKIQK